MKEALDILEVSKYHQTDSELKILIDYYDFNVSE